MQCPYDTGCSCEPTEGIGPASGCHQPRAGSDPQNNPVAKSLSSIPGICAIAATALVATAPDPTMFSAGREFAAWHGPTLGRILPVGRIGSRIGNRANTISDTSLSSKRRSVVW
ncbi:transposase [Bradyrhizobium sp. 174]|nr:transposase [Bradyrhizobium sp. 174]